VGDTPQYRIVHNQKAGVLAVRVAERYLAIKSAARSLANQSLKALIHNPAILNLVSLGDRRAVAEFMVSFQSQLNLFNRYFGIGKRRSMALCFGFEPLDKPK
jgi:hypothetical protein